MDRTNDFKNDRSLRERFWEKVIKLGEDDCWEWKGALTTKGYGSFWIRGRSYLAHRIAYILTNGEIPKNILVLHSCDNRRCVNPRHLFLGTHLDNARDMVGKGRQAGREKNGKAKLTIDDVNAIQNLYREGRYSYRQLAEKFKLSSGYIGCIVRKEYWKLPLAE